MHLRPIHLILITLIFCTCTPETRSDTTVYYDTVVHDKPLPDSVKAVITSPTPVTASTSKNKVVDFAETLVGIPYKYGSTDPAVGFDCSGFITYVFNHFNIKVPRSSVDFTHVGREVRLQDAERGDLILFTGTDSLVRVVGHMGIVTSNTDTLKFIHSTSGKLYGVTVTPLNTYYKGRFVKVIDIF